MIRSAIISPLMLMGCGAEDAAEVTRFAPIYHNVQAQFIADDLVQIDAKMSGAREISDVEDYARCAAAQYALAQGYGFARHLRTNVHEKGGVWSADAVYTISPTLPRGLQTVDAEVTVQACAENGIPTV